MSEEMYSFLINALGIQDCNPNQLLDEDTFNTLWNLLSEKYH